MRLLIATIMLLALALPGLAQGDKAKPNTLTPKEIADGWLLLFDGETTFGWRPASAEKSEALKVSGGAMELNPPGKAAIQFGAPFPSFDLEFEYKSAKQQADIFMRAADGKGVYYSYGLDPKREWTTFKLSVKDRQVYWNDKPSLDKKDEFFRPAPMSCVFGFDQRDGQLSLRNIKLRPLNTTSLFNGNDLAGWNVFPNKKSMFAVVDGAINVKNGPGDLQTAGKYKDFVLQLECKSNGEHLNSGIFFRCRENEYQNGYEAQIRNQFTEKPMQKYLIEEYDPKTNKLIGKKEMLSTAVDFGTGAIYRRMPARKQMSKDGEWFAMTIVAHGNHFATWVNGVQVADWTDHRPPSDNARTGCKLEAGHISIQGHDPTTDLSFRNFRIAEFK